MPYACRRHPDLRLTVCRFSGVIEGATLVRALEAVFADEHWAPGSDVVWDYGDATGVDLLPADVDAVQATVRRLRERAGGGRAAIVAPGELENALARLIAVRSTQVSPREARVFRTRGQAAVWLRVSPDVLGGV